MPRYEFSEGTSNKFWEISLSGKSFTTTYGKIGTSGSVTLKEFDSEAQAKKEYDKLIAEKTKKGYELVSGGGAGRASAKDEDEDEDEKPAPKKAAAKPAPKAAAAPAAAKKASGGGGDRGTPRRFEFSEGTSNKFWEIWIEGTSVMTKYGRIGAAGSQTVKDFGDEAKAIKEYDKLLAEKTKKGYEEADLPD